MIHRPALVVHKPPMVIKQSPIVFQQNHPIVQQPVEQAHDMYVTHNVPQRIGSHVVSAGVGLSQGCRGANCGAPVAYLNQAADNYAPVTHGSALVAGQGQLAGYAGAVNGAGYGADAGYAADGAVDGGCNCADNVQDCGCGAKKTKISRKHKKGSKKHEVTGTKRFFGGHEGGGFGGHEEAGYGREGGFHDHGHGHHVASEFHHGHHDGGDGAWDGGHEVAHGHGHVLHGGDHGGDIHHADEQNIIVQRPDIVFHPRPELYHRPDIVVHRPDIVIHRPSVVIHQPPVLVHRPAVIYHQPPVVFHQPGPVVHRPRVVSHDMYVQRAQKEQVCLVDFMN